MGIDAGTLATVAGALGTFPLKLVTPLGSQCLKLATAVT